MAVGESQTLDDFRKQIAAIARSSCDFDELKRILATALKELSKSYSEVIVAASGGVDSTALFELFWQINNEKKIINLSICHVNFGLRESESDLDEAFCAQLAQQTGTSFHCLKITEASRQERRGQSVQAWARSLRYTYFAELAASKNAVIATAHTLDDCAENLLLRAARGASPAKWLGFETFKAPYWRPLLAVKKQHLKDFASAQQLRWREDSSNASDKYARNRLRHEVLPILESLYHGASERLVELGHATAELSSYIRESALSSAPQGFPRHIQREWLCALDPRVQPEVLAEAVEQVFGAGTVQLSRALLMQILACINSSADSPNGPPRRSGADGVFQLSGGRWVSVLEKSIEIRDADDPVGIFVRRPAKTP